MTKKGDTMEKRVERIRLVLAIDPWGAPPLVVGAISASTWEIIDDEEWALSRLAMAKASGIDRRDYIDLVDAVIEVDADEFAALGRTPTLTARVSEDTPHD